MHKGTTFVFPSQAQCSKQIQVCPERGSEPSHLKLPQDGDLTAATWSLSLLCGLSVGTRQVGGSYGCVQDPRENGDGAEAAA